MSFYLDGVIIEVFEIESGVGNNGQVWGRRNYLLQDSNYKEDIVCFSVRGKEK